MAVVDEIGSSSNETKISRKRRMDHPTFCGKEWSSKKWEGLRRLHPGCGGIVSEYPGR